MKIKHIIILSVAISVPFGLLISNTYYNNKRIEEWYNEFKTYPQRAKNCPKNDVCLTIKNGWQLNIPKNDPHVFIDKEKMNKYWNKYSFSSTIVITPGNKKNFVRFQDLKSPDTKKIINTESKIDISKQYEEKFNKNKEGIFEALIEKKYKEGVNKNRNFYIFNHDCKNKICRFQFFIDNVSNATGDLFQGTDNLTGLKIEGYLSQRGIDNYRMILTEISKDIKKWSIKQQE